MSQYMDQAKDELFSKAMGMIDTRANAGGTFDAAKYKQESGAFKLVSYCAMTYTNSIDRCKCVADLGGGDMKNCDVTSSGNRPALMLLLDQSYFLWNPSNYFNAFKKLFLYLIL